METPDRLIFSKRGRIMRSIEIEYILKNEEGKEVARFSDIEEAKQYDRMLTAAEEIFSLLGNIKELDSVKEAIKDDISFQIAKHSDEIMDILGSVRGRKSKTTVKPKSKAKTDSLAQASDDNESLENQDAKSLTVEQTSPSDDALNTLNSPNVEAPVSKVQENLDSNSNALNQDETSALAQTPATPSNSTTPSKGRGRPRAVA